MSRNYLAKMLAAEQGIPYAEAFRRVNGGVALEKPTWEDQISPKSSASAGTWSVTRSLTVSVAGTGYGERSPERVNSRNGYRGREWDTRAGTLELAIPKLCSGSYFPDWSLQHRRAEQALVSVVATSYPLGVSTRRVEKLVEQLGVRQLSKSQVSEVAQHLDVQVEAFGSRPLDSSQYTRSCGWTRW